MSEELLYTQEDIKIGDLVYGCSPQLSRVIFGMLYKITITHSGIYYSVYENEGLIQYWLDYVYKSKAEAEKKLKELKGDE